MAAPKGARNKRWKGDAVGKKALHKWVRRNFENTGCCEECGRSDRTMDWASIGHVYTRDRADWRELCRSCHFKMDDSYERTPEIRAKTAARARGRRHSPATRAKMSAAKMGRTLPPDVLDRRALGMWRTKHEVMLWACSCG